MNTPDRMDSYAAPTYNRAAADWDKASHAPFIFRSSRIGFRAFA